jgi:hypothetical protein
MASELIVEAYRCILDLPLRECGFDKADESVYIVHVPLDDSKPNDDRWLIAESLNARTVYNAKKGFFTVAKPSEAQEDDCRFPLEKAKKAVANIEEKKAIGLKEAFRQEMERQKIKDWLIENDL